jgi:hypothetical protein
MKGSSDQKAHMFAGRFQSDPGPAIGRDEVMSAGSHVIR